MIRVSLVLYLLLSLLFKTTIVSKNNTSNSENKTIKGLKGTQKNKTKKTPFLSLTHTHPPYTQKNI